MTHLTREQCFVLKSFLKLGVGVLALNRDAEQACETSQEIRISVVELSGIVTIGLENTERHVALATSPDKHIDRTFDAMLGQKRRRPETCLFLQVIIGRSGRQSPRAIRYQHRALRDL